MHEKLDLMTKKKVKFLVSCPVTKLDGKLMKIRHFLESDIRSRLTLRRRNVNDHLSGFSESVVRLVKTMMEFHDQV